MKTRSSKTPATPLLDLPREIRLNIYSLLFTEALLCIDDDGVNLTHSRARGDLIRTCKSLYDEAMPSLYMYTTLMYCGNRQGPTSLGLKPQYQRLIPRLSIVPNFKRAVPISMRILKPYARLRSLQIQLGDMDITTFDNEVTQAVLQGRTPDFDALVAILKHVVDEATLPYPEYPMYPPWAGAQFAHPRVSPAHYAHARICPITNDDFRKITQDKARKFGLSFTFKLCVSVVGQSVLSEERSVWSASRDVKIICSMLLTMDWDTRTVRLAEYT